MLAHRSAHRKKKHPQTRKLHPLRPQPHQHQHQHQRLSPHRNQQRSLRLNRLKKHRSITFVDANSPASKELVSDSNKLVGVEVYSRTGNTLGTVTTFDFDPVFGAIKSITLDNGSEFKSDAFLFFAPDFVFVDDGSKSAADLRQAEDNTSDAPAAAPASTPATQPAPAAQPAAPAANADGLSNEDALLVDFLIGKTLNDDVANADDTFALPKGTEITREIALDAKKHDALLLLTMSVD